MDEAKSFVEDMRKKWDELEDVDKFVAGSAAVLTIGGAVLGLAMGKPAVFAAGAGVSAVIVGVRWATMDSQTPPPESLTNPTPPPKAYSYSRSPALMPRRDVDYTYAGGDIGAPIGRVEDNGPVQTFNGVPTVEEARNFPIMHRVPNADMRTEPLDDRIRFANTPPEGPYTGQTVTGFW